MNKKQPIYVANWKMAMPFESANAFLKDNIAALKELSLRANIVICPSFLSIASLSSHAKEAGIFIGAQDCSAYKAGAYSGQVDTASLKAAGCSYGIIGHSERREFEHETNDLIAQKMKRLIEHNIIPIICVGQTAEQNKNNETKKIITQQLEAPLCALKKNPTNFCIAYEPIWAIGTDTLPSLEEIHATTAFIEELIIKTGLLSHAHILYGGSVSPLNADAIIGLELIDGLLIGSASLDFQKFKNIVL